MGILVTFLGTLVGVAVLAAFIAGFFIWVGSKLAGINNTTIGKSVLAAIACSLSLWFITGVFFFNPIIGFFIGHLICLWIIKNIFETTFGKALLAWIFHFAAQVIAIIIAIATFATGLMAMFMVF
ncbi:MAG: hypothetical protein HZC48_08450 [Nitrospirae bacterium]|nr:hypothetical protein [Nitrospirota bacterium]